MEIFKLFGTILVDSSKAEESISKAEKKAEGFGSKLGNGIKIAAKWGLAIGGAAIGAAGAILKVDEATKEYRDNMAKLNAAYEATGKGTKEASQAYTELYKVLGDQDQATEAAQLLSNLASNQEDIAKWSDIASGVVGRFGDSLPVESLIEASNETAKVGKVTGALADALNWAGISEDEFNEKLAACSSEQERNKLITDTLSTTYDEASEAFRKNNEEVIRARENQALLDESMGKLGEAVGSIKNSFMADFTPSVSGAVTALGELLSGSETAKEELAENISNMVQTALEKLPEFIDIGLQIIAAIGMGIIKAIPGLLIQIPGLVIRIVQSFIGAGKDLFGAGKEMLIELWDGMKAVWESISNWVSEKVSWLVDKLAFWRNSKDEMDEDDDDPDPRPRGSHAGGLAYVPYDRYPAELHRGEKVLNADQAREYDDRMSGSSKPAGDTYIFNSPKPLTPAESRRQMKKARREMLLGF